MKSLVLSLLLLVSNLVFSQAYDKVPGRLVNVNGYNVHLLEEGKGDIPVVMIHGAGDISLIWKPVLEKLSKFTKGVAIDFPGEGWSEHGHAIHMKQQAYDMHQALRNSGMNSPFILVGHSLGGLFTRVYHEMYPKDVAAVVLVDATHPDVVLKIYQDGSPSWKRMRLTSKGRAIPEIIDEHLKEKPELKSFKGRRDFGDMLAGFSKEDQERFNWYYNERPFAYVAGRPSFEAEMMQEVYENPDRYGFNEKPLVVISRGKRPKRKGDENWSGKDLKKHSIALQKDLLKLSTNAKHVIASKSGHHIHLDQPGLVVEEIRKLYEQLLNSNDLR